MMSHGCVCGVGREGVCVFWPTFVRVSVMLDSVLLTLEYYMVRVCACVLISCTAVVRTAG